jgi:hypothetical protein
MSMKKLEREDALKLGGNVYDGEKKFNGYKNFEEDKVKKISYGNFRGVSQVQNRSSYGKSYVDALFTEKSYQKFDVLGNIRLDLKLDRYVKFDDYEKKLCTKVFINWGNASVYLIEVTCFSKTSNRQLYTRRIKLNNNKTCVLPIKLVKSEVADGNINVDCYVKVLEYRNVKKTREVKTKKPSSLGNLFGLLASTVYVNEEYFEKEYCLVAEKKYSLSTKVN